MAVKSRKRGVVASRAKLEKAMLDAGIKTQASLAEKIASNEGLSSAPKDTINRAFRQESVAPTTIARIAKVLDVETYTLYLSKEESDLINNSQYSTKILSTDNLDNQSHKRKMRPFFLLSLISLLIVLIIAIYTALPFVKDTENVDVFNTSNALGKNRIVIYSLSENLDLLKNAINLELKDKYNLLNINRALVKKSIRADDLAQDYQSDMVLSIKERSIGRFIGIQIYLYSNGIEKLIWTTSLLKSHLTQYQSKIANQFIPFLEAELSPNADKKNKVLDFASVATQEKYLQARDLLIKPESELNIKRAQTLLRSAIQHYPKYSNAMTALCESFIEESWKGNEKEILQEAQIMCNKAKTYSPDNNYNQSTIAYLYRKTGRLDQSIQLYKDILKQYPNDVIANSGIASAYLAAFRQNHKSYPNAKKLMVSYSRIPVEVEPSYWKYHSNLGLFSYYANNIELAEKSFAKSAELNPTELAYTNVGTINKCIGNLERAEYFYKKALKIAPDSYLGKEYLGNVYYYQKRFEESATIIKQSLETLNDSTSIHQMWGELGHSYRHSHQNKKSIQAYLKAINTIEKDILNGNVTISDKIFIYQYKLLLTLLDPVTYSKKNLALDIQTLIALSRKDTDSPAYAAAAHSFLIENELTLAKSSFGKAIDICIVFKLHPDLISLTEN